MHARAKRLIGSEQLDFSDIMGTLAAIKAQLQRQKIIVEQKAATVDDLIAKKYIYMTWLYVMCMFSLVLLFICFCILCLFLYYYLLCVDSGQREDCMNFVTCTSLDGPTSTAW
jgi:hypothetical protein